MEAGATAEPHDARCNRYQLRAWIRICVIPDSTLACDMIHRMITVEVEFDLKTNNTRNTVGTSAPLHSIPTQILELKDPHAIIENCSISRCSILCCIQLIITYYNTYKLVYYVISYHVYVYTYIYIYIYIYIHTYTHTCDIVVLVFAARASLRSLSELGFELKISCAPPGLLGELYIYIYIYIYMYIHLWERRGG